MAINPVEILIKAKDEASGVINSTGVTLEDLGKKGDKAAQIIDAAWSTLGAKSFAQTKAEIDKVKAALDVVRASGASPLEIKLATDAANEKIKGLEGGVKNVGKSFEGLGGILGALGPLMATTFGAQQFVSTIASAESLSQSYKQVFGSVEAARKEMEWVKTTANTLGVETLDLAKAYQSLSASTRGTAIEGQATRDVFEAVTRAMGVMGKSSAETGLALNAVSQMASKGTVSMEELRGQLGEALPGALKAAADGAGLTTEQLVAMVSNGNVLAKDMLPALAKGLNDLYGKAPPPQTIVSEWARFKNVVTETAVAIGEGGASKGIASALTGMATAAKYGALGVDILGTAIGEGAAALVTWNGTLTTSQDLAQKYGIAKVGEAQATDKATAATQTNAAAQKEAGKAQQDAAKVMLSMQQAFAELGKDSAAYTASITKQNEARTAETAVLTQLVGIYGTEAEKRQVAAAAAKEQAIQATQLAAAQNAQLVVAQQYVANLQAQAVANKDNSDATNAAIAEAQKQVATLQAVAEKTTALAQSKSIDAAASKAQEQATKDNSGKVEEYKAAVEQAKNEVDRLTAAHIAGNATDEQVIQGKKALAVATLLYRDAIADTENAFHSLGIKTPDELNKIATANKAAWERVKADTRVSMGDLQKAFTAYAESAIAANGGVASETLKSKAAMLGLQITTDSTGKSMVSAMGAGKTATDALTGSINAATTAAERQTEALKQQNKAREEAIAAKEKENELTQRAIDLENKRRGVDKEGFSADKNGQRIVMGGDLTTLTGVAAFLKAAGVADEAKARSLAREFADSQGNITYMNNPGQLKYGGDTISVALLHAAEKYTFGIGGSNNTPQQPSSIPTPAKTYTVNVNLGGTNTAINTSSDADAQALISVLQRAKLSA